MFTFTSLLGAQSNSRASQSLLELDGGIKIVVDVGWDERFDTRQLADIEKHASTLSFILLMPQLLTLVPLRIAASTFLSSPKFPYMLLRL